MAASIIDQLKSIKAYEARLAAARAAVPASNSYVRPVYGYPDSSQSGTIIGYAAYDNSDSGGSMPVDASYVRAVGGDNDSGTNYSFDGSKYLADRVGQKPEGDKATLLKQALAQGVDLRPLYGTTYADAVQFKQDLGQYAGKDQSMIIPANPVGYGGQFQFDPNFGSTFYRDLATQAGKALGLNDQQILQKGTEYFADKFASGPSTKGVIGFTDFGTGLMDTFAQAAGVPAERLSELKGTALKPLYDASSQVFQGLNGAARIESQSSGFFKGIGQDIAKLGPLGTIALGLALGPAGLSLSAATAGAAAGALPGLLQGDFSSALKGGAIGGLGGSLSGLGNLQGSISEALGGGAIGNIAGGAARGALQGGVGSLLSGGDIGKGLLSGGLFGGGASAAGQLLGQTGSALNQSQRANQEFFGLNSGAKSPTIDFGNPQNFGSSFDLPNTIGVLDGAP